MRDIVWSDEALDDFDSAIHFIAKHSARSVNLVADRIERAVDSLADMPTGRPGRVKGTYERMVQKTPHIIAYTLSDAAVRIAHIIHGARDWSEGEWPAE